MKYMVNHINVSGIYVNILKRVGLWRKNRGIFFILGIYTGLVLLSLFQNYVYELILNFRTKCHNMQSNMYHDITFEILR